MVDAKQLEPKMRTVEKRVTFATPSDPRVRVSLETALRMQLESPRELALHEPVLRLHELVQR
jgi:SPX domain protein involved in polyphosphate accumulation